MWQRNHFLAKSQKKKKCRKYGTKVSIGSHTTASSPWYTKLKANIFPLKEKKTKIYLKIIVRIYALYTHTYIQQLKWPSKYKRLSSHFVLFTHPTKASSKRSTCNFSFYAEYYPYCVPKKKGIKIEEGKRKRKRVTKTTKKNNNHH